MQNCGMLDFRKGMQPEEMRHWMRGLVWGEGDVREDRPIVVGWDFRSKVSFIDIGIPYNGGRYCISYAWLAIVQFLSPLYFLTRSHYLAILSAS